MNKFLAQSLLILSALACLTTPLFAQSRSVFFQRNTVQGGAISAVPVTGPATALTDLVKGLAISSSGGLAANGLGSLFYSDITNNSVLIADKAGKSTVVIPASVGLNTPQALAFDPANNFLYVADLGNQRLVRADLGGTLPVTSVAPVMAPGSFETLFVTDIKFNPVDNMIYWVNGALLYRAAVGSSVILPISAPDTLTPQTAGGVIFFDLDGETPQNVYLLEPSGENAIYKASLPAPGNTSLADTLFLNVSAAPEHFTVGLAVDKESSAFCFSAFDGVSPTLGCGDRGNPAGFSAILGGELFAPANYLLIDKSPTVVRPDTQPEAPAVSVDFVGVKAQVRITLESFTGADTKKGAAKFLKALKAEAAKKGGKFGFRYSVELKRVSDADGNPIGKKDKDNRNLISKRNELTVKNLKGNSNYSVRYRVEITQKAPGGGVKVVRRTPFSPTTGFTVQAVPPIF